MWENIISDTLEHMKNKDQYVNKFADEIIMETANNLISKAYDEVFEESSSKKSKTESKTRKVFLQHLLQIGGIIDIAKQLTQSHKPKKSQTIISMVYLKRVCQVRRK